MFVRQHLSVCDSTNSVALAWIGEGAPHKSLVTCDTQTHGRGRQGRTWLHSFGGLACSFILRPQISIERASQITLVTATALLQAIEFLKIEALVKWPNDLLFPDGRKFAGILTEAHSTGNHLDAVIVGIGLNVQRTIEAPHEYGFLSDMRYLGSKTDILESILSPLEFHFDHLDKPGHFGFCLDYLRERSATIGRPVSNGIALDINSDGSLLVQDSQGKTISMYTT
jgi:BirA family biotin operon repressor/biotin-[acetyl-CoA-carboxylase] ligase